MTDLELNSCRELQRRIEHERSRIESLREVSAGMTRLLDGVPHGRPQSSQPERFALLIMEAEAKLSDLQAELDTAMATLATQLTNELSTLPTCLSVMIRRYVGCATFSLIARQLHYSRANVFYLHNRGLDVLGIDRPKKNCQKSARF